MKNSLLKYGYLLKDNMLVSNYSEKSFEKVSALIKTLGDEYFETYTLQECDKLERLSLEIYNTEDYWDIILIINAMNPLFDMPYDLGTLMDMSMVKSTNYIQNTYNNNNTMPIEHYEYMADVYNKEMIVKSDNNKNIIIIRPSMIQNFLKELYDIGIR